MNCQFLSLTKGARCIRPGCSTTLRRDYEATPNVQCVGRQLAGDWIHAKLTSIGITEEFVAAALQAIGLPPECGCEERAAKLNEWTAKAISWWKGRADAAI